jgi:uncharacterized LabA/DUF88 family protein
MIRIREILAAGTLGEIRAVFADHTQKITDDPSHRLNALDLGGGALLDLGIYPISFFWDILGAPVAVTARARLADTGADADVSTIFTHASGAISTSVTSSRSAGPNTAHIIGTEARIDIDRTWYTPTSFRVIGPDGTVIEDYVSDIAGRGMQFQALAAEEIIARGETDSPPARDRRDRGDHGHPRRHPHPDRRALPRGEVMADQNGRVAVYLDFDNIVMSWYDRVHGRNSYARDRQRIVAGDGDAEITERLAAAMIDVGAIIDYAATFGTLVLTRAYADWSSPVNAVYRSQLVARAVDLVQLFPAAAYAKNGADIRLAVDAVEDMFRLDDLTHVVIVAGDSDYVPLAQRCKRLGRFVVGIGVAGSTAKSLAAACDQFHAYDALPGIPAPAVTEKPEAARSRSRKKTADPRRRAPSAGAAAGERPRGRGLAARVGGEEPHQASGPVLQREGLRIPQLLGVRQGPRRRRRGRRVGPHRARPPRGREDLTALQCACDPPRDAAGLAVVTA